MTAMPSASEPTPAPAGSASATEAALAGLEASQVTRLARRVLADAAADMVTWAHEPLSYTVLALVSGGLFRVHGTARSGGATVPWSLVLKITKSPAEAPTSEGAGLPAGFGDDPSHEQYWKREAEAYRAGLLSDLPGRLVAPRCYDVVEHADRGLWLWLEAIDDEYGGTWPLSRYGLAARHLGQFNGAYLTGRPLPAAPWLVRAYLSVPPAWWVLGKQTLYVGVQA